MKIIRVDMTNQTVVTEKVPQDYLILGGRGLTSIMINDTVGANDQRYYQVEQVD